jgi:hypothetical protein
LNDFPPNYSFHLRGGGPDPRPVSFFEFGPGNFTDRPDKRKTVPKSLVVVFTAIVSKLLINSVAGLITPEARPPAM